MSTNANTNEQATAIATPAIDLAALTPEQIASLRKQLKATTATDTATQKKWNTVIDALLQDKDEHGFKHTTGDMLQALIAKSIVAAPKTDEDRSRAIKKIQTRKQLLEKKTDKEGKKMFSVGYRASDTGFTITLQRVLGWLEKATTEEKATVHKATKPAKA